MICECLNRNDQSDCTLVGDFNFRDIDWVNGTSLHQLNSMFINTVMENGYTQLVDEPTRGPDILGLVLITNGDLVENLIVMEPFSGSGHNSINLEIFLPKPKINEEARTVYLYSKGGYETFTDEILNQDWESRFRLKTVEEKWDMFKVTYFEMLEKYVPLQIY